MHKHATYQQPNIFFVFKLYELFEPFPLSSGHFHTSPTSSEIPPPPSPARSVAPFVLNPLNPMDDGLTF